MVGYTLSVFFRKMTALHVCAEQGHADVMELLIKAGAEVLF